MEFTRDRARNLARQLLKGPENRENERVLDNLIKELDIPLTH